MIDYHVHTKLCKHASGEVDQYVEHAIKKGIKEIAFTDHIPLPYDFDIEHRMSLQEMELYLKQVENARGRYPEIKILLGIEADYYEGFEDFIYDFNGKYDFDLVILSIHFLKHWPQGNWVFDYDFSDKSIADIYTDYMMTLKKAIRTELFDVVGHIDIIKKPGMPSMISEIPAMVDEVLDEIKRLDMTLEINTSGYRKAVNEPYPGLDWLKRIKDRQIPVCIGSDAHKPDQVALNFNQVYGLVKEAGFKYITHYQARTQHLRSI